MKILVTGGEGFIGKHLCRRLRAKGHEVVSYDAVNGDWCQDYGKLRIAARHCEFVYHLAATVGVARVLSSPQLCIKNNLEALSCVCELGIPGIYTSSSEVYGMQRGILAEDDPMVLSSKSRWSYAASKLCGEWLWNGNGRKSVRLFNVIGVGQNEEYGAVFPTFMRQAFNGEPITVHGDGTQVRSFTDVRDTVRILDELRDKDFDVVNVGNPFSYFSVGALARAIRMYTGSDSEIRNVKYPHSEGFEECPERFPDLSKLESLLGKQVYHSLEETIKEVMNVQARSTEATGLSGVPVRY